MNEEKNRMDKSKENHTDMYVYVHTLTNTQTRKYRYTCTSTHYSLFISDSAFNIMFESI